MTCNKWKTNKKKMTKIEKENSRELTWSQVFIFLCHGNVLLLLLLKHSSRMQSFALLHIIYKAARMPLWFYLLLLVFLLFTFLQTIWQRKSIVQKKGVRSKLIFNAFSVQINRNQEFLKYFNAILFTELFSCAAHLCAKKACVFRM